MNFSRFAELNSADSILARRSAENHMILQQVGLIPAHSLEPGDYGIAGIQSQQSVRLVDVAGLIDLNEADPSFLEAYLAWIGMSYEEVMQTVKWMRDGNVMGEIDDLYRVSGSASINRKLLSATATVLSKRQGVAKEAAPNEFSAFMGSMWQSSWQSPTSDDRFEVFVVEADQLRRIGAVEVTPQHDLKILRVD